MINLFSLGILTGTTNASQNGAMSNRNEGELHIAQSCRIGASPLDAV